MSRRAALVVGVLALAAGCANSPIVPVARTTVFAGEITNER